MTTVSTTALARRAANGNGKVTIEQPAPELIPLVDIYEGEDALLLLADMPGASTESVSVVLEGTQLTVSAERMYGERARYQRVFHLPNIIDPDGISAELSDGVLRVQLKKSASAKRRTIRIQA
jgi:HSP20 family molecular chaperone IbpA